MNLITQEVWINVYIERGGVDWKDILMITIPLHCERFTEVLVFLELNENLHLRNQRAIVIYDMSV